MTEELSFLSSQLIFDNSAERMSHLQELVSTFAETRDDWLSSLLEQYNIYKMSYLKHLLFDPDEQSLSKILSFGNMQIRFCISDATIEHARLQAVYIHFGTATYDEIERDVKVTKYTTIIADTI